LGIFLCKDAQFFVHCETIIRGCYLKGLNLLKPSVHIDIHPTILYVSDMFNISK